MVLDWFFRILGWRGVFLDGVGLDDIFFNIGKVRDIGVGRTWSVGWRFF